MIEVNQQLIAERLKISRATVSRCFTNHPGISPLTRARVFKVAAELGYTHLENRTLKARRSNRNLTFGVLICSEHEKDFNQQISNSREQLLAGITECAHLNSAKVEVHFVNSKDCTRNSETYSKIRKMRPCWKGIILVHPIRECFISQLSLMMPVVSLVEQSCQENLDRIDTDHHKGISAAIEHLHQQGHHRIGFFTKNYPPKSVGTTAAMLLTLRK